MTQVGPNELIIPSIEDGTPNPEGPSSPVGAISHPAKLMRIGMMAKQLLDEVHTAPLDDGGRARMREIYQQTVTELSEALSPELAAEMGRLTDGLESDEPTDAELRVAQAQLVGWLEGLFQGIQASLFVQQMAAQNQLEQMRHQAIAAQSGNESDTRTAPYL
jgi:hypothetical protein